MQIGDRVIINTLDSNWNNTTGTIVGIDWFGLHQYFRIRLPDGNQYTYHSTSVNLIEKNKFKIKSIKSCRPWKI